MSSEVDAVVVGSGPNGLVAAITLARAGRSVVVLEGEDTIGGGARSAELTLPGFVHDICSAIHPLGAGSPAMQSLPLAAHGLRWLQPELALAHPLDGARAGVVERDPALTARRLGGDATAWRRHVGSHAAHWKDLAPMLTRPLPQVPRHPLTLARFGIPALAPANWLGRRWFADDVARALFAGCAAHAFLPLGARLHVELRSGAPRFGPRRRLARGRAAARSAVADALEALPARARRRDRGRPPGPRPRRAPAAAGPSCSTLSPRELVAIAGDRLRRSHPAAAARFRHGPAAFKVDYALDGPVPWTNPDAAGPGRCTSSGRPPSWPGPRRTWPPAATPSARSCCRQQSLVDPSRAPGRARTPCGRTATCPTARRST